MQEKDIVIVAAKRTAIGSFGGALKSQSAVELGKVAAKGALESAGIKPEQVDATILGCVLQASLGQNVARQVSIGAGVPVESPAFTINQVCGSGLKAVILGANAIALGDAEIVLVGGTESMSQAPYAMPAARWGARMGDAKMVDVMVHDGLWDIFGDVHMGITAENIAERFGVSRQEQDDLAAASQQKAVDAIEKGEFKREIVPVSITDRKGRVTVVDTDEFPRKGTTVEVLAKLKPAFKKGGTVTAGNASGINDGAAALILMTRAKANQLGLRPMASIVSYATAGVPPEIMGTGPVPASQKALQRAKMAVGDLDIIEANEAFAAQACYVRRELKLPDEKLNMRGGAIALGHPIGASGARILTTLIHLLQDKHKELGLATLCVGGGMGVAVVVKAE